MLEYGQKVDRRILTAVFISPLCLQAKKREHFLAVGYDGCMWICLPEVSQ